MPFQIRELDQTTWPDFVRIMEKHGGVWGGCWCVEFHLAPGQPQEMGVSRRELKEKLVRANRSHAALVYDDGDIAGWCQFGPPAELPARMGGFAKLGAVGPDWRFTCFFVDRDHRKQGVSAAALKGALRLIAAAGGGTVDGYPTSTRGKRYSRSFLWAGTESMFAGTGFKLLGALGKTKLVMRKVVRARR